MSDLSLPVPRPFPVLVLALAAAEILAIALVFQFAVDFDCRAAGAYAGCMAVRNSLGRGIAALAVIALVPALRGVLLTLPPRPAPMPWPLVQVAGVVLILMPALAPASQDFARTFHAALPLWGLGAALAATGTLLWLAPAAHWARLLRPACAVPLAAALVAPELLGLADRLWSDAALPDLTFAVVARGLAPFGAVEVFPAERLVHLDNFAVEVAGPCSGMEGFALISALLATHLWIERRSLRWPRALLLFPLAIAASFALNAVRIGALVLIGARVSPELAINGFHSHAGWLAFTLLAFALIALTRLPALRAETHAARASGDSADDSAALILPFVATMLAALALDTFAADPAGLYPLRAAVMLLAVLPFAGTWARLGAPEPLALALGLAVGAGWLLTAPAPDASGGWLAVRIAGAVLLTPLVEEAFFRGYLQPRLIRAGVPAALAVVIAAALFGLLHGRWLAGTLAGVVFGLAALRRGRLSDAVAAHVAANAALAAWALATAGAPAF
ncbi:MAG: exosortase E/protease, VPEID-CTERM system [Amaricoccus sp.]|uniref:exosortase E/protease, VPEID-CTERM system n=1 Tax=Amaricoccus sp. TaxID=1872485 RepID=UPI0039E52292